MKLWAYLNKTNIIPIQAHCQDNSSGQYGINQHLDLAVSLLDNSPVITV